MTIIQPSQQFSSWIVFSESVIINLWSGLGSWQTLLPCKASDMIVQVFLKQGASVWVL